MNTTLNEGFLTLNPGASRFWSEQVATEADVSEASLLGLPVLGYQNRLLGLPVQEVESRVIWPARGNRREMPTVEIPTETISQVREQVARELEKTPAVEAVSASEWDDEVTREIPVAMRETLCRLSR